MSDLTSLGQLVWIGLLVVAVLFFTIGIFQLILVWPARLINGIAKKSPNDDFGGKVIALSFATGPFCIYLLIVLFDLPKGDYVAWGFGWLLGVWAAAKLLDQTPKA